MFDIKILVVDDNESDLLLFREAVESIGMYLNNRDIVVEFTINEVCDGASCLYLANENDYDLIFLDIKMPKMDGIECLEKLKKNYADKFKIIMFTTSDYSEDVKKTKELGANGYVTKSLDIMEFEENLKATIILFMQENFVYINFTGKKYK